MIRKNKDVIVQNRKIEFFEEPTDLFQSYMNYDWLNLLATKPNKCASVQHMILNILYKFYIDRFANVSPNSIIICERFMTSAKCFIKALKHESYIDDLDELVLLKTVECFEMNLPSVQGIFYLSRDTEWCLKHIVLRNRQSEIKFITKSYLDSLFVFYEQYLESMVKNGVTVVKCNEIDLYAIFLDLKKFIEGF